MTILLPNGLMYGCVAPPLVRNVAKGLLKTGVAEVEEVSLFLGVSAREAKPIWDGMVADGWIIQREGRWVAADHIRTLASARIGKPLSRQKAEGLLAKLLKNAEELNKLPPDVYNIKWVTRIAVFGSFLGENSELGDLDVAIEFDERIGGINWDVNMMMYGRDSCSPTRAKLIPRGPYVRCVSYGMMMGLECPYKIVYTFDPPITDWQHRKNKNHENNV